MEDFIAKDQQFVADWLICQGLDKLVEVFLILCIFFIAIRSNQLESTYTCFVDQGYFK